MFPPYSILQSKVVVYRENVVPNWYTLVYRFTAACVGGMLIFSSAVNRLENSWGVCGWCIYCEPVSTLLELLLASPVVILEYSTTTLLPPLKSLLSSYYTTNGICHIRNEECRNWNYTLRKLHSCKRFFDPSSSSSRHRRLCSQCRRYAFHRIGLYSILSIL